MTAYSYFQVLVWKTGQCSLGRKTSFRDLGGLGTICGYVVHHSSINEVPLAVLMVESTCFWKLFLHLTTLFNKILLLRCNSSSRNGMHNSLSWFQKPADDRDIMGEVSKTHEAIQYVVFNPENCSLFTTGGSLNRQVFTNLGIIWCLGIWRSQLIHCRWSWLQSAVAMSYMGKVQVA